MFISSEAYTKVSALFVLFLGCIGICSLLVPDTSIDRQERRDESPGSLLHRSARETHVDCFWHLKMMGTGGTLKSPNYPSKYPSNARCWWLLTTAERNATIILRINTLRVEEDADCNLDYLQIYLGNSTSAPTLGLFCGTINDQVIKTNSNQLLLMFQSNSVNEDKGFSIDFYTIIIEDCHTLLSNESGSFQSPGFPENYPDNTDCWTQIIVSEDRKILLFFDSIDLAYGADCTLDYIQIFDGTTRNAILLGTICDQSNTLTFTSSSNSLLIHFHSDADMNKIGYSGKYLSVSTRDIVASPEKLVFSHIPQDAVVSVGSSHSLYCSTEHPKARILWLKGDTILSSDSPLPGLSVYNDGIVWIRSMDYPLSGEYSCIAVTPDDMAISKTNVLIKSGQEQSYCGIVFGKIPEDSEVAEGERASMQCLTAASSHVQFSWEKDGHLLKPKGHIKILTIMNSSTIIIDKVRLQDAGIYSCVAEDTSIDCSIRAWALLQVNERVEIDEVCGKPKIGQPSGVPRHMLHGKIVGGNVAKKGAYPWHVTLWEPDLGYFCAGTLLNERWIVTAAHCFSNHENLRWDRIVIKLGKYETQDAEKEEFQTIIAGRSSIKVHPDFSRVTYDNDIALVRLRDHVRFTDYILPVCLGDTHFGKSLLRLDSDNPMIKLGTIIGFGKLSEVSESSTYLQEVKLPIVDQITCMESTNFTVTRNMFCAGYSEEIVGDACVGDAGGPFLMLNEGRWYLVGIISWGEGCGRENKYGFYTRVPNYIPWIKEIISK